MAISEAFKFPSTLRVLNLDEKNNCIDDDDDGAIV
jgi:hypothetical protein